MYNKPDAEGLAAARAWALEYDGDPSWADSIINAYLNPESAMAWLTPHP